MPFHGHRCTLDAMREVALIYGLVFGAALASLAFTLLFARAAGARVTEVYIGFARVARTRIAGTVVTIGLLPGTGVGLHGRDLQEDDVDDDPRHWTRLGLARRLLIIAGPPLVLFSGALALLGPAHALRSLTRGLGQIFFTVDVTPLVREFLELVRVAPLATSAGIVLTKMCATSLMPCGGSPGEQTMRELLGPRPRPWVVRYSIVSMAVFLLWVVGRFAWAAFQLLI